MQQFANNLSENFEIDVVDIFVNTTRLTEETCYQKISASTSVIIMNKQFATRHSLIIFIFTVSNINYISS